MKAFYAGSFDPFTNGHLYVLQQAAQVFEQVILGIGCNPEKQRNFPAAQMKNLIEEVLRRENFANVKVLIYDNLTVQAAKKVGASFLVRGLRNGVDYAYEENLALINKNISGLETIYFRAGEAAHVSASSVLQLWHAGIEVQSWVPEEVAKMLQQTKLETSEQ